MSKLFQSDKTGKFHFSLKAGNGQIIGQSQQYKTESDRDNGIASVGKNCGSDIRIGRAVGWGGSRWTRLRQLQFSP